MRRRRAGAAISLFAFQDIITSVSAIVIVMVLLMTLELVERPEGESASQAQAAALREAIAQAEAEIDSHAGNAASTDDLIRNVAQWSAAEMRQLIGEQKLRNQITAAALDDLQHQGQKLAAAERAVEADVFDGKAILEELAQARSRNARLEGQVADEAQDERPIYSMPRGSSSEGWLVVCEADRVVAARVGRSERPTVFTARQVAGLVLKNPAERFAEWAGQLETSPNLYFLVLVRPGGIGLFDEIQVSFDTRNIRYGYDAVDTHLPLLHPERGAAP